MDTTAGTCRVVDHGTTPTIIAELTRDEREAVVYLLEKEIAKMRESAATPATRALVSFTMLQMFYEQALWKIDGRAATARTTAIDARTGGNDRTATQPDSVHAVDGRHHGGTRRRHRAGPVS